MGNLNTKTFNTSDTWTCPAGINNVKVTFLPSNPNFLSINRIVGGYQNAFILDSNNICYGWGLNSYGGLGNNSATDTVLPTLAVGNHSFVNITVGSQTTTAIKSDGSVWSWGNNNAGQVGNNLAGNISSPCLVVGNHSFIDIKSDEGMNTGIGQSHTLGLKSDGSVWSWGYQTAITGALGYGVTNNTRSSPALVIGLHSFVEISAGTGFSLARKYDGTVWAWGQNFNGQLGINIVANAKSSPVLVAGAHSFIQLSAGDSHTLARKYDGTVWAWGLNTNGGLGSGAVAAKSSPNLVIGTHSFIKIKASAGNSFGLKQDGSIWSWGVNTSGVLGDNTVISKSSPVIVVGGYSFVDLAVGGTNNTFGIKLNGEVWTWGNNATTSGLLLPGLNSISSRSSPVIAITTTSSTIFTNNNKLKFNIYKVTPGTTYNVYINSDQSLSVFDTLYGSGQIMLSWME